MTKHEKSLLMTRCVLALISSLLLAACGVAANEAGKAARKPVFPVEVIDVSGRTMEYAISAVGSVEAFEEVLVTARVRGVIEKICFREGQEVLPNEVLVEIEPQRYRNELEIAQSKQKKANASLTDAQAGLKRRVDANAKNPGIFSPDEVETWENKVNSAKADVSQTDVDVKQAELNLSDAFAKAPIGGIIQTRSVQTGAYVQPGALMATLLRRDPLLVRFSVPEQEAAYLSKHADATFSVRDTPRRLKARITHVAAAADVRTRMVAVTAEVDAVDGKLVRPGAFAQVRIVTGSRENAPAIPQTAVRPSERGFLAYVVENGLARERVLTLGLRTEDGMVEVREGLKPGEKLVVRGGEALRDGVSVKIDEPGKARESNAPAAK